MLIQNYTQACCETAFHDLRNNDVYKRICAQLKENSERCILLTVIFLVYPYQDLIGQSAIPHLYQYIRSQLDSLHSNVTTELSLIRDQIVTVEYFLQQSA